MQLMQLMYTRKACKQKLKCKCLCPVLDRVGGGIFSEFYTNMYESAVMPLLRDLIQFIVFI